MKNYEIVSFRLHAGIPRKSYSLFSTKHKGIPESRTYGIRHDSFLFLIVICIAGFITPSFAQTQGKNEVDIDPNMIRSENWFNDLEKAKQNPDKVIYLDLSLQKLKTFPKEILTFKNLERLYLPYNYWPSIPEEIGTLTKLQILDLSGNYYMNFLPIEGLAKLTNLKELIIKDNKLAAGQVEKLKKALPNTKIVTE